MLHPPFPWIFPGIHDAYGKHNAADNHPDNHSHNRQAQNNVSFFTFLLRLVLSFTHAAVLSLKSLSAPLAAS